MHCVRALLIVVLLLFCVGCSKKPSGKRYEIQGEVVAVDSAARQLTVAHEEISFTKQAPELTGSTTALRLPRPGNQVPDFTLVNQDGKYVHLADFRGKPLLLTFIYTRCPIPDFCLRMSNNFSEILKQLHTQPQMFDNTQLLSISIDPEHDTPTVLRHY